MPWKDSSVVRQRTELMEAMLADREPVLTLSQRFGVSRQTAYKFLTRYRAYGAAGLRDRLHTPVSAYASQAPRWRARLLRLRKAHPTWGARKLRWLLGDRFGRRHLPAERTLQRWIARAGLVQRSPVRRRTRPTRQVRATVARRSNAVWTIDLKGWFRTANGTKVEPLTVRDLWSRFVLWSAPLAPRDERSVRLVCQRLFRRHGRPHVIRCDRGAPFFGDGPHGLTRLSLWWWRLGIRVEFVRRGQIDNNAHEQMHRVLKADTAIAWSARAQARSLERWRQGYNRQRPHESLGLQTPASRFHSQPCRLPVLHDPSYPATALVRWVEPNGKISFQGWRGSIGRAFGGLPVRLDPAGFHRYRVYFASLYLGRLELNRARLLILPVF